MKLLAVRHGETEWNKIALQQGHLDSPLTELGVLQARALAEGLSKFPIDFFYSSDLGRAIQTAEIIQQSIGLNFFPEPRLRERNLGVLQGMTKAEFRTKLPIEAQKFEANNPDYELPDGESIRQRYERSIDFIHDLTEKHKNDTVLVVSHGGVLMSYMQKCLDIPMESKRRFSLYNGSINIFTVSESREWRLEQWGAVDHLRKFNLEALDDN